MPCLLFIQWAQLSGKDYNPINTSRPGIGNPTAAVPTGLYQFEMGANSPTLGKVAFGDIDSYISTPMLIRMGIYDHTELQVGYANKYFTIGLLYGGINIINGFENSLIITTSQLIPIQGKSYIENNDSLTEYSAYLPISYLFQNGFSVSGQIAGTAFNNNKLNSILCYSFAISNSVGDKNGWFFETYQFQTIGNESTSANIPISIDYGITYLSDNNIQFDLSMGLTFQKYDSDYSEIERFFECGVSLRL